MGAAKPPHTTSPRTSYRTTSGFHVSKRRRSSNRLKVAMMPRPAQPRPGVGPPVSMHSTPPKPSRAMSPMVSGSLSFSRI